MGGSSVSKSYRFCLQIIFVFSPFHPAFPWPLQWCQLTHHEGCGGCRGEGRQDVSHCSLCRWRGLSHSLPKTDLATPFSWHKPPMAVASRKCRSQRGTPCYLYSGCCLLFLLYGSQLPLFACISMNISSTLQLCFHCSLPKICSQHFHMRIFVALFIALSSRDQFTSSLWKWEVGVCSPPLTLHCVASLSSCKRCSSLEFLLHIPEGP